MDISYLSMMIFHKRYMLYNFQITNTIWQYRYKLQKKKVAKKLEQTVLCSLTEMMLRI